MVWTPPVLAAMVVVAATTSGSRTMTSVIGVDIAKRVFQVHTVDEMTGEIRRWTLSRAKVLEFFGNTRPSIVAMEACGSSHHWARRFAAMGHEARLIATKFVRPFVKTNKTLMPPMPRRSGSRRPDLSGISTLACRRSTKRCAQEPRGSSDRSHNSRATSQIGAAVVTTFMLGGSSVGVCDLPATHASTMSAHSCSM